MHEIIFDDSFCIEKTNEYKLSIQVSLDGFSFSIVNPQENRLLAFKHTPLKISNENFIARRFQEWIETEEILKRPFSEIQIVINTNYFTLIPNQYFSEENNDSILKSLFEIKSEIEIKNNNIENFNAKLLFGISKSLNELFHKTFKNPTFLHPVKILTHKLPEIKKENGLELFFSNKDFYTLLFDKNQLLLANSFNITHPNDTVFYILTILKQFAISAENVHLFLAGDINIIEKTENELKKYFSQVDAIKTNPELNIHSKFPDESIQSLITLLY